MWTLIVSLTFAAPPAVVYVPRLDVVGARKAETRQMGWMVQQELVAAARRAGFDAALSDDDECPSGGCPSVWFGASVVREDNGCAVTALVGTTGKKEAVLVPWVGTIQLTALNVGFREPPESLLTVRDFVPCDRILTSLREGGQRVEEMARSMLGP